MFQLQDFLLEVKAMLLSKFQQKYIQPFQNYDCSKLFVDLSAAT